MKKIMLLLSLNSIIFAQVVTAQKTFQETLMLQVFNRIENNYYLEIENIDSLAIEALKSFEKDITPKNAVKKLFSQIDIPSFYFDSFSVFENQIYNKYAGQKYVGIGLVEWLNLSMNETTKHPEIITLLYKTPAFEAGLQPKDEILAINGTATENLFMDDIGQLLKSEKGDSIHLLIGRQQQLLNYTIVADSVQPLVYPFYQTVKYRRKKYGIIWLPQFTEGTGLRILEIVKKMEREGVKRIILDLRHNPGGFLTEAQLVAGLFFGERPLAYNQSRNSAVKMIASVGQQKCNLPLSVITNSGTAGVAEIVASSFQYHKRAEIYGLTTFGKALVHQVYEVESDFVLTLPISLLKPLNTNENSIFFGVSPNELFLPEDKFQLHKSYKNDSILKFTIQKMHKNLQNK